MRKITVFLLSELYKFWHQATVFLQIISFSIALPFLLIIEFLFSLEKPLLMSNNHVTPQLTT